jgi:hypothetical protein
VSGPDWADWGDFWRDLLTPPPDWLRVPPTVEEVVVWLPWTWSAPDLVAAMSRAAEWAREVERRRGPTAGPWSALARDLTAVAWLPGCRS